MKRTSITRYFVIVVSTLFLVMGCDEITTDLSHLNTNPDAVEELNANMLFTNAQLGGAENNYLNSFRIFGQSMQYFSSNFEVPATGDKYFNESGARSHWGVYANALREIQAVINELQEGSNNANKLAAARVWKVYLFHVMTDIHGDIPYSEALSVGDDIIQPKYDTQEAIYEDMLSVLDEAAQSFSSEGGNFGSADLMYSGNPEQWRMFTYSLMLRLAMRLTEVRPDLAQTYTERAIAGGPILEDEDIARVEYSGSGTEDERNPKAEGLLRYDYFNPQSNRENREGGKYSATFIDHLKETNDPRLPAISVVWRLSDDPNKLVDMYTDPEMQEGLESGVHFNTPENFSDLSEPHPNTVLSHDSPILVMTNAEVWLLMAEAALRGWYSGSEEEAYNNAVRAGMRHWALFGDDGVIADDRIEEYIQENPYPIGGSFEERLEAISVQKWVSLFLDHWEVHANWRRTGYPALIPANYPGNITGGTIPRRFIIPDSELNENEENYREALERQDVGNDFTSTVWWDRLHPRQQFGNNDKPCINICFE